MKAHASRVVLGYLCAVALGCLPAAAAAAEFTLPLGPAAESVAGFRLHYDDAAGPPFGGDFAAQGASPVDYPLGTLDANAPRLVLTVPTCTHVYLGIASYDAAGNESESVLRDGTVVGAPQDVVVKPGPDGKLIVRWSALPADDTGVLAGYRIHYDTVSHNPRDPEDPFEGTGADQGDSPFEVGADTTSVELTGLTVGDTIHLMVEAYCADTKRRPAELVSAEVVASVEPGCDNWIVEPDVGETCDPPGTCPTADQCEARDDACTVVAFVGSAAECTAECAETVITSCVDGDGCCPVACNSATDDDCSAECGNDHVDDNETCDPPSSCPSDCNDDDACTADSMTGSAANCNVECNNYLITSCVSGDGCCPTDCTSASDDDCEASEPTDASVGATDSSTSDASDSLEGGGCSVDAQANGSAWLLGLALLGLALLVRRRRR